MIQFVSFLLLCFGFQFEYLSNLVCQIGGCGCDVGNIDGITMNDGRHIGTVDCLIISALMDILLVLIFLKIEITQHETLD